MKPDSVARFTAITLISLLPNFAYAAEANQNPTSDYLTATGERIRQTGAQLKMDIKKARERLEAQQAKEAADRKREVARVHQQAIKKGKQRQAKKAARARARQGEMAKVQQVEREKQLQAENAEREKNRAKE